MTYLRSTGDTTFRLLLPATAERDEVLDTVVCNLKNIADQLMASNI